ncbi:DUF4365 domain-containing protein [Nocardia sp. CA2R105]|uniref:DUF4365 domain-containing protein n=1 Tax=Nocardia coffeae TaxID=2873381 RepID=UPI001CA6164A|nr:DUF4365 domain-containing protein [Nocardia coffeae]MBY8863554.1 DUF4365 domain-containing protein [Nocardia coffeae]
MGIDTNRIDREAVGLCEFQTNRFLGHAFREQGTSDFGVDAHVELKRDGSPTGRLVGLQLKAGRSRFGEETDTGWKFRPKKKHIPYWLGHSLPMYVLLIDTDAQTIYWQELSERTLETGPRGGIYVVVPKSQTLPSAGAAWEVAAERFAQTALSDYSDNLSRLPPSVVRALAVLKAANADSAALIAAHLARGRGAPEVVIRTLTGSDPAWLSPDGGSIGLVALAEYAVCHNLAGLAIDLLLVAAERTPESKYNYTRNAALIAVESDLTRARELLEIAGSMPEASGDMRLEIGRASLTHPEGSAAPVALSEELETQLNEIEDDEVVLFFLARRYENAGELDRAVSLFERALACVPDSAAHMEGLACALSRRAQTPRMQPTDHRRATQFASDAVDQLHDWSGPTESALPALLQCLIVAGEFTKVLDRSLTAPDGRATIEESQRPEVRTFAASAATALERRDLAMQLIDSLPQGVDQDLARLRLVEIPGEIEDRRAAWIGMVERLDRSRPEALLQVVMRLSDLGVDESARLDPLVDDNLISPDLRDLAVVSAKACVDLDAALPKFRLLAERSELGAAKLVDYLASAERFDDAEVASSAAYVRFGKPEFALRRAEMLICLDRDSEAYDAASDALSLSFIDPSHRRIANRLLALLLSRQIAKAPADMQLWRRIERHLNECVNSDELVVEERDVWQLAEAQMRLGEEADAFETLVQHEPTINAPSHARLWTSVMLAQPTLNTHVYARMLELADTFADDIQLSAALLTAVTTRTRGEEDEPATPADQRAVLDGDRRAAAFAALQAHVERYGDRSPIKILQAPTTDDLIRKMTELARRDDGPLIELAEAVRQVRLPLGMLALAAGKPYSSILAARPLGYFIAAAALEDDDLEDEEAANNSLNRDVVVDVSALLIASELGEFDSFRGNFRSLLVPATSQLDVRAGRAVLEGQSSSCGTIRYDAATDSIAAVEIDVEDHLAALARFSTIEKALASTQAFADTTLEGVDLPGSEPWLGPIALAKHRGVPLWSDDLAQRRVARALGVKAFGTTTLQQLRTADRLDNNSLDEAEYRQALEKRRREVLNALRARIVDVPTDCQVVIDQGNAEEWNEQVALVTIGRPGWWHMAVDPWGDLRSILIAVQEGGGPSDAWRFHAMWGVARVAADDPNRSALLLACAALVCIGDTLDDDKTAEYIAVANKIAAQCGASIPSEFLIEAATALEMARVFSYAPADVARLRTGLSDSDENLSAAQRGLVP